MPVAHRAEMLERLGRVLDAQAAWGGQAARERINLLLDRDAPFLELSPLRGTAVVGIGPVDATVCVIVSADDGQPERDDPKVRRAMDLADGCGLPLVMLGDTADHPDTCRRHRQHIRWQDERAPMARRPRRGDVEPPRIDADGLLDVPAPRRIVEHLVDGSHIDEQSTVADSSTVTGWGTLGGLPIAVVARDAANASPAAPGGAPRLSIAVTPMPGTAPQVTLAVSDRGLTLSFAWPGPELTSGTDHDGVIDPRDSRIVAGIARWCLEPR